MAISFAPSSKEVITLTATCHCTLFHTTFTLPASSLPLKASLCHCTTCRKTTGHILPAWAVIPSSDRPDVSALTAYASSDTLLRYFCPRCGASIADFEAEEWDIATGVLDWIGDGLLSRAQLWLEDTKDGGAGLWLGDTHYERFIRGRNSDKLAFQHVRGTSERSRNKGKFASSASDSGQQKHEDVTEDCLNASCRCGAVSFQILRPDTDSNGNVSNKYPAGLDACKSCRAVTGCEITSWAFVPRDRIRTFVEGKNTNKIQDPLDLLDAPALSYYKTSPSVTRGFCSTCGANIFYYRHRGRTGNGDTIDIAAGLLESGAGVRAEDWLVWDHYGEDIVAYREDALDKGLVESLFKGIKEDSGS